MIELLLASYEVLREGILCEVFLQRCSAAWEGAQGQRLTISIMLPGRRTLESTGMCCTTGCTPLLPLASPLGSWKSCSLTEPPGAVGEIPMKRRPTGGRDTMKSRPSGSRANGGWLTTSTIACQWLWMSVASFLSSGARI